MAEDFVLAAYDTSTMEEEVDYDFQPLSDQPALNATEEGSRCANS